MKNSNSIIILFTIQFSVRVMLRTGALKGLLKLSKVIVILFWEDDRLVSELKQLGCKVIIHNSTQKISPFILFFRLIKSRIHNKKIDPISVGLNEFVSNDSKRKISFKEIVYNFFAYLLSFIPFINQIIEIFTKAIIINDYNYNRVKKIIIEENVNLIISMTPFIIDEWYYLKTAKIMNIYTLCNVLSFDNIITRNEFAIKFDKYFVWNNNNINELNEVYNINKKDVVVIGPMQFDFYYKDFFLKNDFVWRKTLKIPLKKKIILFAGGFVDIVPNEHKWLKHIDDAITQGLIKNSPIILFRIHPVDDYERWKDIVENTKNIIIQYPWKIKKGNLGKTNITNEDIINLCSTLKWTDVHINASSTMTVDGSIFDKPQIGPAYDESINKKYESLNKLIYERRHFKPIKKSGGLKIVYSEEDLIKEINYAIDLPENKHKGRKKIIKEICQFDDGKSTERFLNEIKKLTEKMKNA